jgi:hypothetical protein
LLNLQLVRRWGALLLPPPEVEAKSTWQRATRSPKEPEAVPALEAVLPEPARAAVTPAMVLEMA